MIWPDITFPPINLLNVFAWQTKVKERKKSLERQYVKEEIELMGLKIVKTKRV